jgi:hypothetical protein
MPGPMALRPAPIPPCFSGPPGSSCIPRVPSGPSGVSWIPPCALVPSGVSLDPPACPPVPLVSLGSCSGVGAVQLCSCTAGFIWTPNWLLGTRARPGREESAERQGVSLLSSPQDTAFLAELRPIWTYKKVPRDSLYRHRNQAFLGLLTPI